MAGNSRSIVLQERDLRLFEALESMRVINREQAKVVAGFQSTRRANDRLLRWKGSEYRAHREGRFTCGFPEPWR